MKKILITGANSYIGTSFEKYMAQWPEKYQVDTVDMIDGTWREKDFSGYDTVFHVAGIAHQKETQENAQDYYKVNRDLAVKTAEKAKMEGVEQFVFLSSMSVYGVDTGIICQETRPEPISNYGKSKLQAEQKIGLLQNEDFHVVVLRPPMVYGKGCKGNYQSLVKLAAKLPIFPKVANQRSMIYIENLCEFVRLVVESGESGIFFPQNEVYSNTSQMVCMIGWAHGKKIYLTRGFNWGLPLARRLTRMVDKAFGSLYYEKNMSCYSQDYCIVSLEESIRRTEE